MWEILWQRRKSKGRKKEGRPVKEIKKENIDRRLAGLAGVGWQKAKGAASHHPLLSILHLSADNDSIFVFLQDFSKYFIYQAMR